MTWLSFLGLNPNTVERRVSGRCGDSDSCRVNFYGRIRPCHTNYHSGGHEFYKGQKTTSRAYCWGFRGLGLIEATCCSRRFCADPRRGLCLVCGMWYVVCCLHRDMFQSTCRSGEHTLNAEADVWLGTLT